MLINREQWPWWSEKIAAPAEPRDYSPAAVKRLMLEIDKYVVDVKGVRPQFNALNSVALIDFQTKEEREFYEAAWNRYEEARKKVEGYELSGSQSRFLILAQFTIFRKAAELCRAEYLADAMYESVQRGEAACLAVNFKGTIRAVTKHLVNKYGVSRDDISLIWGGGKTKKNEKQKKKEAVTKNDIMQELMGELGLNIKDLNLDTVEDYVDDDPDGTETVNLRLGTQSKKDRQREIDRFQKGLSRYCMFTFKAGGVGLSLHHSDELTEQKVRRKKNNWAIVEDIPSIPTRPRVCFLAPTFSAIELVQGLGRCPRLTSLSDTKQVVVFYRGTIEERVAALVSLKLRCLREVVRTRESWEDCIVSSHTDKTNIVTNEASENSEADAAENTAALFGDSVDEDDEEVIEV